MAEPDPRDDAVDGSARRPDAWEATARALGLKSGDELVFLVLVPLVGIITGFVGVGIYWTLDFVQHTVWSSSGALLEAARAAPIWQRVLAPTIGGVLVSAIVIASRQEVRGHGMSGIIEAVALRGGRLPAAQALLREIAGIATVGTGGSLGREGPMIRTGAMLGSVMGRWRLPDRQLKILVGCGAAAGMAAAYNAPIGSALFVMEVILGNFALELFGPIVVASVCATVITRALRGPHPVYEAIPDYKLVSSYELPLYLLLGCCAGVLSVAFSRGVRSGEPIFDAVRFIPKQLRPIIGMAIVGAIGIGFPEVYGNGFDVVSLSLREQISPWWLLLLLPFVKVIATAVTLGSGCSGGLFTPTLLVGALTGECFGVLAHRLFPEVTATPGAYALVGMAAITAGTSHAPVSAIMIVFEMTGKESYDIILPLMLASIASALIARRMHPHSIYMDPLARRGVKIPSRFEEIVLESRMVDELLRHDVVTVAPDTPLSVTVSRLVDGRRTHAFVVDQEGRYRGGVALYDVVSSMRVQGDIETAVAADVIDPAFPALRRDERLSRALETLARVDAERLPVVDAEGRLAGMLAKRDVLAVYMQEVLGAPNLLARIGATNERARFVQLPPGLTVRELVVPPSLVGRTLGDLALPQRFGLWALAVERLIDGGVTRERATATVTIERGDRLVLLGTEDGFKALAVETSSAAASVEPA